MSARPRIYLADPDMFRRYVAQRFGALKAACGGLGLEALAPSDGLVATWAPENSLLHRS